MCGFQALYSFKFAYLRDTVIVIIRSGVTKIAHTLTAVNDLFYSSLPLGNDRLRHSKLDQVEV